MKQKNYFEAPYCSSLSVLKSPASILEDPKLSFVTRITMVEPIEAEFAIPPVYTDREERALQNHETDIASNPSSTTVTSQSAPQVSMNSPTEKVQGEMVSFDGGESPREWSAGKKWYVRTPLTIRADAVRFTTMATSGLCLTVALGSAMPTGDLHGTAIGLNTSDELIYLSITLFVVAFGVGPLIFAPRISCVID